MKPPRQGAGPKGPRSGQKPAGRAQKPPLREGGSAQKRDIGTPRRGDRGPPPRDGGAPQKRDSGAPRQGERGPPKGGDRVPVRTERKDPHAPQEFFVDGLSALSEYARFKPDAIQMVEATPAQMAVAERLLREHGVLLRVSELPKRDATDHEFAPVRARVRLQALDAAAFEKRLETGPAREHDLILALDHITDPRNLGAVVRSAAFFGVREVVAPERRQVLFTQASVATAQGGFALTELVCVVNLSRTLDELKERGYWIIGTAMDGLPYADLVGKYEKVVLVLGSEDSGLALKV